MTWSQDQYWSAVENISYVNIDITWDGLWSDVLKWLSEDHWHWKKTTNNIREIYDKGRDKKRLVRENIEFRANERENNCSARKFTRQDPEIKLKERPIDFYSSISWVFIDFYFVLFLGYLWIFIFFFSFLLLEYLVDFYIVFFSYNVFLGYL